MLKAYVLDFAEIFACVKTKNGVNTSFEKKLFCLSNMDSGSAEEHSYKFHCWQERVEGRQGVSDHG